MKIEDLPVFVTLKAGVEIDKINKYIFGDLFFNKIKDILCIDGIMITSGCESINHASPVSAHYNGDAVDIRIWNICEKAEPKTYKWWILLQLMILEVSEKMPAYNFVLEKDHLHIQIGTKGIAKNSEKKVLENLWIDIK